MATTLVGIFDNFESAQAAVRELSKSGIKQTDVSIARNEPAGKGYTTYGGANSKDYTTGTSVGDKISNFFTDWFGTDASAADDQGIYMEAVRRGSVVVLANVDDSTAEEAADILNNNGAVDVDRRAAQYRAAGYKNYDHKAPLYNAEQSRAEFERFASQGEVALPVIEEQLAVGKRVVQRGAVRVHTRVTERPVEETVNLREEHVRVERTPVNRQATEADLRAAQTGEVQITERSEVPVVGKESRVVEEVHVGKETTERQETVRDTVKKTNVEVEEIDRDADQRNRTAGNRS